MTDGRTADRGSGTVWVLALSLTIALAATASGAWGLAAMARHGADAAADLAALAAAGSSRYGPDRACAAAAAVAQSNGAKVTRCQLTGDIAEVAVSRPLRFGRFHGPAAVAMARAGPVSPPVGSRVGLRW